MFQKFSPIIEVNSIQHITSYMLQYVLINNSATILIRFAFIGRIMIVKKTTEKYY